MPLTHFADYYSAIRTWTSLLKCTHDLALRTSASRSSPSHLRHALTVYWFLNSRFLSLECFSCILETLGFLNNLVFAPFSTYLLRSTTRRNWRWFHATNSVFTSRIVTTGFGTFGAPSRSTADCWRTTNVLSSDFLFHCCLPYFVN